MKTLKNSRVLCGGDTNPKNLHAYGDEDGVGTNAKLQHPLGVHFIPEKNVILVADTYNHKIKVIDPFKNEVFTWLGNGKTALKDDNTYSASFNEPSGFGTLFDSKAQDVRVYIADCNNHCIRMVMYDTGDTKTVEFKGIPSPEKENEEETDVGNTTSKSGAHDDDMVDCDGNQCFPKFF